MTLVRGVYRARQFFLALGAALGVAPAPEAIALAEQILTPAQLALFRRMSRSEQAHSLIVLQKLTAQNERDPNLLTAALLHDVGKTLAPLRLWQRVIVVLGQTFFPRQARHWGEAPGKGPFVTAAQHPAWGAQLAAQAGCSPTIVQIILHHQDRAACPASIEPLLRKLQAADNES
jgi:hypothetical protein